MNIPAPLTPPGCDLRGLEWMPLHGAHVFMSDLEGLPDRVFRVALRLWWAAWQQVPAASLPDDDRVLCMLAGMGRNTRQWKRLRAAGALAGFAFCLSDRRHYHVILSSFACNSWEKRTKERQRKASYRAKSDADESNKSNGIDEPVPRDRTGTGRGQDADRDGDRTRMSHAERREEDTRRKKKDSSLLECAREASGQATEAEAMEQAQVGTEIDREVRDVTRTLRRKAAPRTRSAREQLQRLNGGGKVRHTPLDPVRTVDEQLAALKKSRDGPAGDR